MKQTFHSLSNQPCTLKEIIRKYNCLFVCMYVLHELCLYIYIYINSFLSFLLFCCSWPTVKVIKIICGDVGQSFQENRIAAIHYSDFVYEDFPFNQSYLEEEVAYNIQQIPKHSGSTCTGDAFNYARVVMLKPEKGSMDLFLV